LKLEDKLELLSQQFEALQSSTESHAAAARTLKDDLVTASDTRNVVASRVQNMENHMANAEVAAKEEHERVQRVIRGVATVTKDVARLEVNASSNNLRLVDLERKVKDLPRTLSSRQASGLANMRNETGIRALPLFSYASSSSNMSQVCNVSQDGPAAQFLIQQESTQHASLQTSETPNPPRSQSTPFSQATTQSENDGSNGTTPSSANKGRAAEQHESSVLPSRRADGHSQLPEPASVVQDKFERHIAPTLTSGRVTRSQGPADEKASLPRRSRARGRRPRLEDVMNNPPPVAERSSEDDSRGLKTRSARLGANEDDIDDPVAKRPKLTADHASAEDRSMQVVVNVTEKVAPGTAKHAKQAPQEKPLANHHLRNSNLSIANEQGAPKVAASAQRVDSPAPKPKVPFKRREIKWIDW